MLQITRILNHKSVGIIGNVNRGAGRGAGVVGGVSGVWRSGVRHLNNGKPQNPEYNKELRMKIMPIKRTGEDLTTMRARLLYQSRKRGILESDLLLSRFAKKYLNQLELADLKEYDELLDEADWDIYYWATENYDVTPLPDRWKDSKILKMLVKDAKNEAGEILRMPELDLSRHE